MIVTFQMNDVSAETFETTYTEAAPVFAEMPGLIEKLWLKQPDTNTFGGVYLWEDQAAAARYRDSEMFQQQMRDDPHIVNLTVQEYGVLDNLTRITRELSGAAAIADVTRPDRPSQAEGDPDTIDAMLKEKEARGEM
jgi:heme-degrading monooxygenase HmoA